MGIWFLGLGLYLLIAGLPQVGFPGLAPWLGATLPSFLVGFVVYALASRRIARAAGVREWARGLRRQNGT